MPVVKESHAVYTIQPGDSLHAIASRLGSSVGAIQQANLLYPPLSDPNLIYPGITLLVPLPAGREPLTYYVTAPGDSLYRIAQRFSIPPQRLAEMNEMANPGLLYVGQSLSVPAFAYVVEPGDKLSGIARRFGISVSVMVYANEGRPHFSLDRIYTGYRLLLPYPFPHDAPQNSIEMRISPVSKKETTYVSGVMTNHAN